MDTFDTVLHPIVKWVKSGGPVMWPIIISSVYGVALCVERWLFYRREGAVLAVRWKEIESLTDYSPGSAAAKEEEPSLASRLFGLVVGNTHFDEKHRAEILQVAFLDESAVIEKYLGTVSVIATLLPMLGLLGTIGGMISAFGGIAEHGAGDPKYVADGISKALVATASGLISAIPLIYIHQILAVRADYLTRRLDEYVTHLVHICPVRKE